MELWDFALEVDKLYELGLTNSDLRWLIAKGNAQLGRETSVYGDAHRSFRPREGLNFTSTTCFMIAQHGYDFAGKALKAFAASD